MSEFDEDKFIETLKAEGREDGLNMLGNLISRLLSSGRQCDIQAAAEDPAARLRLMKEFGLINS